MSLVKAEGDVFRPLAELGGVSQFDDRATVGAEPRDVGQHPLIRGFTHIRLSVWGCPGLRSGVDRVIGLTGRSGIPLAAAPLPPLHEICLHRTMPRRRLPEGWLCGAARSPRKAALLCCRRADLATDG